jgi:hypothetical protein
MNPDLEFRLVAALESIAESLKKMERENSGGLNP